MARTIDAVTRGALIPIVVAISACAVGKAPDPSSGQPGLVPTDCSHCAPGQNCLAGSGECYCDSNLCPGCCAADGRCLAGNDDGACGNAGGACHNCALVGGASSTCQAGTCSGCVPNCNGRQCGSDGCGGSCGGCPHGSQCGADGKCGCTPQCAGKCAGAPDGCGGTCSSNSCTGCCEGTICQPGLDVFSCGSNGAQCHRCGGGGSACQQASCVSGSCIATPLPDGTSCGSGQSCYSGQCQSNGGTNNSGGGGFYNSCYGYCFTHDPVPGSSPACYCDPYCLTEGDCCPDADIECGIY